MNKKIVLIGGGTISHVRNHLALCAPAYGTTVRTMFNDFSRQFDRNPYCSERGHTKDSITYQFFNNDETIILDLYLTKMAQNFDSFRDGIGEIKLETNDDICRLVNRVILDKEVKVIIFNPALVDFDGQIDDVPSGKYATRLETSKGAVEMRLTPTDKIIGNVKISLL